MNYKSHIIILAIILVLSFSITAQAETISLLSSSDLTATPQALYIKLEIQGESENQSRLQNQFPKYVNDLKSTLLKNSNLNARNISQSQFIDSSYIKQTGYNNPQVYEKKVYLEIKFAQQDAAEIQTVAEEITAIIKDNNPRYHNTHYNSLSKLKLNYEQAYYCFEKPQLLQKELLNDILEKNKKKSAALAELLANNSVTLNKIEEVTSADIPNHQQNINLNQPQLPTEVNFKSTLRIDYQLK